MTPWPAWCSACKAFPTGWPLACWLGLTLWRASIAYLFGTISGAVFTSSVFMAVQATGAMSIILADVPAVHSANEQAGLWSRCRC
jgi:SulP family sulfate permease